MHCVIYEQLLTDLKLNLYLFLKKLLHKGSNGNKTSGLARIIFTDPSPVSSLSLCNHTPFVYDCMYDEF